MNTENTNTKTRERSGAIRRSGMPAITEKAVIRAIAAKLSINAYRISLDSYLITSETRDANRATACGKVKANIEAQKVDYKAIDLPRDLAGVVKAGWMTEEAAWLAYSGGTCKSRAAYVEALKANAAGRNDAFVYEDDEFVVEVFK